MHLTYLDDNYLPIFLPFLHPPPTGPLLLPKQHHGSL